MYSASAGEDICLPSTHSATFTDRAGHAASMRRPSSASAPLISDDDGESDSRASFSSTISGAQNAVRRFMYSATASRR